ncbi:claudin-18-like [Branchiostoma floridae]|uniref:Claudin-18-like n=1 Tax=Branchiostoma floridae TaxID=7739 RepID=A0A9J7KSS5_BRAFL|nr:claudin-18-like [Branchiostoma floridae]
MIICGIISAILGLVLYIVGIATNAWMSVGYQESGLWRVCGTIFGVTQCVPTLGISLLPGAFNAARAFAVIGLVLLLPGIAVACFAAKKNSDKGKRLVGNDHCWRSGICGALAGAIYAGYAKSYAIAPGVSVPFGYSFYMIWVQALFTWVGGGVITNAGSSDVQVDPEGQ